MSILPGTRTVVKMCASEESLPLNFSFPPVTLLPLLPQVLALQRSPHVRVLHGRTPEGSGYTYVHTFSLHGCLCALCPSVRARTSPPLLRERKAVYDLYASPPLPPLPPQKRKPPTYTQRRNEPPHRHPKPYPTPCNEMKCSKHHSERGPGAKQLYFGQCG